jgi:hypothetical protein
MFFSENERMTWPEKNLDFLNLNFLLLNAENLFLLFDRNLEPNDLKLEESQWQKLSSSIYENKPLQKVLELQKIIQEVNPDILLLCEVGGEESLRNFNEFFLGDQYFTALMEGNSDRHIDVGFLIRKSLPFYFDLQSNKNRPIHFNYHQDIDPTKPLTSLKFSRDVVELKLFKSDRENPFLLLLLGHLKSHLDPEKKDPHGFERRKAEMRTLIEIHEELIKLHPRTPQIVAGDFNGNAARNGTDPEFQILYERTQLEDVLELEGLKNENRWTFCQIRQSGKVEVKQLDYAFLSPELRSHLKPQSAHVYRFKDEFGFDLDRPVTLDAKLALPSDHYPLIFELEKLPVW